MTKKKILCTIISVLLLGTSICSVFAADTATNLGTATETAVIGNMERISTPVDFDFEIVSVDRDTVTAEFTSSGRISTPPYVGEKGTKNTAEKASRLQYVLEYDKEYSFVYSVTEDDIETVYNSFLTVERGSNIKVVFNDIIKNEISDEFTRTAGTKTEIESNNNYSSATRTYDDYDNHGALTTNTDVDWWVVSFLNSGTANFWLGNIPTNCDYELELYASNGTTLLMSSENSGNTQELITCPVEARVNYYVKIYSYSGSSTSQYLFRTKNYSINPDITSGNVYRFKNAASNKYLNVHYGYDANYTNVYQYTDDGSVELTFRVVFDNALDAYYIYPMCSSNGRSRVLDIYNTSGLAAGCNVQIYNKNSFTSDQTFDIISVGNNKFKIVMASNNNLALTAYGTSNGSGTGTSSSSAGNVYLSTYNDLLSQQWYIEEAADNHEDYYASLNWAYMFRGDWIPVHISCDYGYRSHPITGAYEFHTGIDISEYGIDEESIYSVAAGKVLKIIDEPNTTSGRGHCIIIEHSDTVYGSTTKLCTMYMHMKDPSPFYKNDNVTVNDIIGYVGSTGGSTGPHLHFSVISNGSTGGHNASNTIEPMFFYENITFTFDEY